MSGRLLNPDVPPLWRAEGHVRLLVIVALCMLPVAAPLVLVSGLSLPRSIDSTVTYLSVWMLAPAFLSFVLTPITVIYGVWSVFKSKIDRRIKILIAVCVLAQSLTAISLVIMLFVGGINSGGRLPH